jgi:hypothetical protein
MLKHQIIIRIIVQATITFFLVLQHDIVKEKMVDAKVINALMMMIMSLG